MLHMAPMTAGECRTAKPQGLYYAWLAQAENLIGEVIDLASEQESKLADLYLEGFTPEEALIEMRAQQELQHAA